MTMKSIFSRILEIENGRHPPSTCFDYVDSLVKSGQEYGVVIFVEPAGNIVKFGDSWVSVLGWFIELFRSQPSDWDYATAGWHLYELGKQDGRTITRDLSRFVDPTEVWRNEEK